MKPPISLIVPTACSNYGWTCSDKAQRQTIPLHLLDPGMLLLHHPAGAHVQWQSGSVLTCLRVQHQTSWMNWLLPTRSTYVGFRDKIKSAPKNFGSFWNVYFNVHRIWDLLKCNNQVRQLHFNYTPTGLRNSL